MAIPVSFIEKGTGAQLASIPDENPVDRTPATDKQRFLSK